MIHAPPVKINYNQKYTGPIVHNTTVRTLPLAWKKKADELVANLLNSKIIEKAPEHQGFVSATKFVRKSLGRLRFTVDYSPVNKAIVRTARVFLSQQDLLR